MEIGYHIARFNWTSERSEIGHILKEIASISEESGVGWLTLMDHYFQMERIAPPTDPMLEGYVGLSYLAASTSKLKLGLLVTGVTYRHPGLLAKIVSSLDVLSGGRAFLGIGAAWYEKEHLGLGVDFPPIKDRFEMLEETIQICLQMFSDNDGKFEGKHYSLAETICNPRPIQVPHPPILIGGSGERKTLSLVARYGDACNLFGADTATLKHKLDVLKNHCETFNRDYDAIEKTMLYFPNPLDDTKTFFETMSVYESLGISKIALMPVGDPVAYATRMGEEILPKF